jgi:tight adherence protein B
VQARRVIAGLLLVGMLFAPMLPAVATAGESALSVQDIVTTGYPKVTFKVGLPPLLTTGGSDPTFSVQENGRAIAGVKAQALAGPAASASVILLIDTSGSMAGKPLEDAKAAARGFVDSLGPDARVAVVAFADTSRVISGFSSDRKTLDGAIASLRAGGETAVYEGLVRAARLMPASTGGQRGIVLLSDGGDTVSSVDFEGARTAVADAGAPVYAVALVSKEANPQALAAIADSSGGRLVQVQASSQLTGLFESIASEIRNAWAIEYTSEQPRTKDIEIQVGVSAGGDTKTTTVAFPNPAYASTVARSFSQDSLTRVTDDPVLAASIGGLVFLSVALIVGAGLLLLVRGKANLGQLEFYDQLHADAIVGAETAGAPGDARSRIVDAVGRAANRRGLTTLVAHRLEAAGLPLRAAEYMTIHIVVVALASAAVQMAFGNVVASLIVVMLATAGPIIGLSLAVSSRRNRFEAQLPDILNMIAGSLRGGWGIQQALGLVVQQSGPPAAAEFKRVDAETRLGMSLEQSLQRMADRIESPDFQSAVTAISIQREVGGNLAEVLDIVAATIRERAALKRHVSSLTAESRLSAYILVGLPFLIFGALFVLNRSYLTPLLTTGIGLTITAIGSMLLVVGIVWIFEVSKVEV